MKNAHWHLRYQISSTMYIKVVVLQKNSYCKWMLFTVKCWYLSGLWIRCTLRLDVQTHCLQISVKKQKICIVKDRKTKNKKIGACATNLLFIAVTVPGSRNWQRQMRINHSSCRIQSVLSLSTRARNFFIWIVLFFSSKHDKQRLSWNLFCKSCLRRVKHWNIGMGDRRAWLFPLRPFAECK